MDSHGMKGAAFMQQIRRLCILRTAYCRANGCTCIMHFLLTIDFSRIRSFGQGQIVHNVSRKDILQSRQIRGDKTRHANSLCKCRFLQPRNRFIIGDTVISQVHAYEFGYQYDRDSCRKHVNDELIEMTKRKRRSKLKLYREVGKIVKRKRKKN